MLEIEFVDRSVALAGKAFVSFFPLVIVIAAFMPPSVRDSIFTTLTHRLGIEGGALTTAKQAFASADQIRKATGILGLVLTIFFATSFTTALQRVFLRAWRRPGGNTAGEYVRGFLWFFVLVASMAFLARCAVCSVTVSLQSCCSPSSRSRRPRLWAGSLRGSCLWASCNGECFCRPVCSLQRQPARTPSLRAFGCPGS
jgi:uncharacterized BrkB/YihY/UPF0761 family membrane protein